MSATATSSPSGPVTHGSGNKGSKTVWIILGLLLVLVLCGCCIGAGVLGYKYLQDNPNLFSSGGITPTVTTTGTSEEPTPTEVDLIKGLPDISQYLELQVFDSDSDYEVDLVITTPEPGNHMVAYDVQLTYTGTGTHEANSMCFFVTDSQGNTYDSALFSAKSPEMEMVDLHNGEDVRGWVSFEVPENTVLTKLTYKPWFMKGDGTSISL